MLFTFSFKSYAYFFWNNNDTNMETGLAAIADIKYNIEIWNCKIKWKEIISVSQKFNNSNVESIWLNYFERFREFNLYILKFYNSFTTVKLVKEFL